jgi:hypothetical protein
LNSRQWRDISDAILKFQQWRDIKDTTLNCCRWRDINETTLNFRIDEIRYNFSDLWHVGGCLPFSSTHNTDRHDLTELLLKVPWNTHNTDRHDLTELLLKVPWNTNNTDRHDLTELLLKVPWNTNSKIRLYYCVSPSKLLQHLERKYYI